MLRIAVLRPYRRRIRERVFSLLSNAGFDMNGALIVPAGASDTEVIDALSHVQLDAILAPFHAHRDRQQQLLNGLDLLAAIHERRRDLRSLPVFMPISAMGMSSAGLMLSRPSEAGGLLPELRARILFMPEEELGHPSLPHRIAEHARSDFGG